MTTAIDYEAQADVLDDAADLIEKTGWYCSPGDMGTTNCAASAIGLASGQNHDWNAAHDTFARFVGVEKVSGIFDWNDALDGPQPVLDALRSCAKELRILAEAQS